MISVIIPNLHSPTVDRTLHALQTQDFPASEFEIIVVGQDRFGIVRQFDRVTFDESDAPLSPAAARNRGARQARGDILAFTDADCTPQTDWLQVLAERFSDPAVEVLGGAVLFEAGNYWTLADNISMFYSFSPQHPAGQHSMLASLNLALRKACFEQVGGFDERYPRPAAEDSDLCLRLRKLGVQLHFTPRLQVLHSPQRRSLAQLIQHGYYQGMYSVKVDPLYAAEPGLPAWLRRRWPLRLASPLLALAVTARVFAGQPWLLRWLHTAPAVYLSKVAWCLGASRQPWGQGA